MVMWGETTASREYQAESSNDSHVDVLRWVIPVSAQGSIQEDSVLQEYTYLRIKFRSIVSLKLSLIAGLYMCVTKYISTALYIVFVSINAGIRFGIGVYYCTR